MHLDEARRFALSLPGATEQPHHDLSSFRVRNKIFATVPPGDLVLHVLIGDDDARRACADQPSMELLPWGSQIAGVRIILADAPAEIVRALLYRAWAQRAPRALTARFTPAG